MIISLRCRHHQKDHRIQDRIYRSLLLRMNTAILLLESVEQAAEAAASEAVPAASAVAESIIKNQGKMITCAAYLDGEYGMKDIMIGVPVVLGKNGIERIVEIELTEDEKAKFAASEAAVRKTNSVLYETGILK